MKAFEEAGYIRRRKRELIVVRHEELLDEWFFALKQETGYAIPVRSMYGDSVDQIVERVRARTRGVHGGDSSGVGETDIVVGHHLACHLHGVGRSSVRTAMLYVSGADSAVMEDLDLVQDASEAPALWLVYRHYEAVRQGAVMIDGLAVCDILQCYLDVRGSRARGQEQADYLADTILLPHLGKASQ